MGKRGPKPKPTALRVFEGSRIRHPANRAMDVKPESTVKPPAPPKWLGEYGRREWRATGMLLHKRGLLTTLDIGFFAQYCQAFDTFHEANAYIREHGLIAIGSQGNDITSPAVRIKNDASNLIHKFGREFGLNPSSRVGLPEGIEDPGADDLESFKGS